MLKKTANDRADMNVIGLTGQLRGQYTAKGSTELSFQNIERGVQCRVSVRHFEKVIVGNGHLAGRHELLLCGVELERLKADCDEDPLRV